MLKPAVNEIQLQSDLEQLLVAKLLPEKAQQQFKKGNIGREFLIDSATILKELSADYLSLNSPSQLSHTQALAYALYFTPINFIKVLRALQSFPLLDDRPIRLLDYGCGPATASLAALALLPSIQDVLAVDREPEMLNIANALLPNIARFAGELPTSSQTKFDLIICANSLNEFPEKQLAVLLQRLDNLLTSSGHLVIVEPAIKSITQKTMRMRDWLTQNTSLSVLYPCTHSTACPMLIQSPQDWCHTELSWQIPKLVQQLDHLTGFNKHRIKTSLFIFSKSPVPAQGYRIVNFPKKRKQGVDLRVCGENCFEQLIVPKKVIKKIDNYDFISTLP